MLKRRIARSLVLREPKAATVDDFYRTNVLVDCLPFFILQTIRKKEGEQDVWERKKEEDEEKFC